MFTLLELFIQYVLTPFGVMAWAYVGWTELTKHKPYIEIKRAKPYDGPEVEIDWDRFD
jgi:hypothetical protein